MEEFKAIDATNSYFNPTVYSNMPDEEKTETSKQTMSVAVTPVAPTVAKDVKEEAVNGFHTTVEAPAYEVPALWANGDDAFQNGSGYQNFSQEFDMGNRRMPNYGYRNGTGQPVYMQKSYPNNGWSNGTWNGNGSGPWNRPQKQGYVLNNSQPRKVSQPFSQQQQLMSQKYRRGVPSYPGKNVYSQYDNGDGDDLLLPFQDQSSVMNGNRNNYCGTKISGNLDPTMVDDLSFFLSNTGIGDNMSKGTDFMNMRPMPSISDNRGPFFPGLDEQTAAAIMENPSSHIVDGHVYMASLPPGPSTHPLLQEKEEKYSRKVFVGGLPPDIDEEEISASFRRFGQLLVDWPHKAESKSYYPPKGYAFLLFQEEASVQALIDSCIQEEDKLYLVVSSPSVKDKAVQIRPWRLNDADFVLNASLPLDPRKTVFVGGVPRPLKAAELATIMDRLYGHVCYAGIDTDPELKYPKGAGRVAFSSQQSYIAAISARFVQLQYGDIDKRVEVKPYVLDDQMCDECSGLRCSGKFAPFFCANVTCLQYYCEHCWGAIHSRSGREYHKPLVKEGAERPRPLQFRWC